MAAYHTKDDIITYTASLKWTYLLVLLIVNIIFNEQWAAPNNQKTVFCFIHTFSKSNKLAF